MREHELKTWPEPFEAVRTSRKRYEIRDNDRGFAIGDTLRLREWDPDEWEGEDEPEGSRGYTGRELSVRVTYITEGGRWGVKDSLCVMSIRPETAEEARARLGMQPTPPKSAEEGIP